MTVLIKKKILVQSLMTGDFISIVNVDEAVVYIYYPIRYLPVWSLQLP